MGYINYGKEENVCRDNQESLLLSNELNISTHQEKNKNEYSIKSSNTKLISN